MKLLLCAIGSHGDIHPYIALARALTSRGHEAILCVNPYYEQLVLEAGVCFVPLGERVELSQAAQTPGAMSPLLGPIRLIRGLLLPQLEAVTRDFDAIVQRIKPDACVLHPIALGGPIVCERHAIPWIGVALAPVCWWNANDTMAMGPLDPQQPSRARVRFILYVGKLVMQHVCDGPINKVRASFGLAKGRDHFRTLNRGGVLNLGFWSPHYRPAIQGDPVTARVVGFPWFDRIGAHESYWNDIETFLANGNSNSNSNSNFKSIFNYNRPLVFTLGTAAVHVAGAYFKNAALAAERLGVRAILLTGKPDYAPKDLPKSVVAFPYAPFSKIFSRALINIHHCGIGTTAQALRSGQPMLCCPMAHDQYDNAARCVRLGVGLSLHHGKATPQALARELARIINDPTYLNAAARIAPLIAQDDGALQAAIAIEEAHARGAFQLGNTLPVLRP